MRTANRVTSDYLEGNKTRRYPFLSCDDALLPVADLQLSLPAVVDCTAVQYYISALTLGDTVTLSWYDGVDTGNVFTSSACEYHDITGAWDLYVFTAAEDRSLSILVPNGTVIDFSGVDESHNYVSPACINGYVPKLDSITVDGEVLEGDIRLDAGERITFGNVEDENEIPVLGVGVTGNVIRIGVTPEGAPDAAAESAVLAVSGTGPDHRGNIRLVPDPDTGCFRWAPEADADVAGLHHIRLTDDCVACCSCEDYVAAYARVKTMWVQLEMEYARLRKLMDRYKMLLAHVEDRRRRYLP